MVKRKGKMSNHEKTSQAPTIPGDVLDAIIMNQMDDKRTPMREQFYRVYEASGLTEVKHQYALALLDHRTPSGGKFEDYRFLFDNLLPRGYVVDKKAR